MHRNLKSAAVVAAALAAVAAAPPAAAEDVVAVPRGRPVLLDGRVDPEEWKDAATIPLGTLARAAVKESDGFVFVAVELLTKATGSVDLYLAPGDGKVYDLHASAKLGERVSTGGPFPDAWRWWNNAGWTANVARVDSWERRSFLDEKAREFQLERARFGGTEWRVLFELQTPGGGPRWDAARFPPEGAQTDPARWLRLRLGAPPPSSRDPARDAARTLSR